MTTTRLTADRPSDSDVARAAQHVLDGLVILPPGSLHVTVRDGIVTLTGSVEWELERETVHNLVAHLRGARGIVDQVAVVPDDMVSVTL